MNSAPLAGVFSTGRETAASASVINIGAGDVLLIPPGHDAWVVGNEPCVQVDFTGMEIYAKKA